MIKELARSFAFELPKGLIDSNRQGQCSGTMRLATGLDEVYLSQIEDELGDRNYAELMRFSRVITRLGSFQMPLRAEQLEQLFLPDLAYLKEIYLALHQQVLPVGAPQEMRYPLEQLYEEVALIAFYFHWSQIDILSLDHVERDRWVREIHKLVGRL